MTNTRRNLHRQLARHTWRRTPDNPLSRTFTWWLVGDRQGRRF